MSSPLHSLRDRLIRTLAVGVAAAASCPDAQAQNGLRAWEWSGNVKFVSEWIDRGLTQTNGHAVPQAGLSLSHESGFYLDAWGTPVDLPDGTDAELDFGAGFGRTLDNGFSFDVAFYTYVFPGAPAGAKESWEAIGTVGYDFGPAAVSAVAFYTADGPGSTTYLTAGAAVPLAENFGFDVNVGRSEFSDPGAGTDYWDWNVGLHYALPWADLSLHFHMAEDVACGGRCKDRIVFSIGREF